MSDKISLSKKWQGFTKESKRYMDYPNCGKWHFWKNFPIAFLFFYGRIIKSKYNVVKHAIEDLCKERLVFKRVFMRFSWYKKRNNNDNSYN